MIITLILTMRATKHYVTSFKFLRSAVASKKMINCVWMTVEKLPCTEFERENREDYKVSITKLFPIWSRNSFWKILVNQNHCLRQSVTYVFLLKLFLKRTKLFKRIRIFPRSKSREKCMTTSFRRICEPHLYG